MYKNIQVLAHSSIRITDSKIIYLDPYMVEENFNDAEVIFITHKHPDHFSTEDILKVISSKTVFIMPKSMKEIFLASIFSKYKAYYVEPDSVYTVEGISFETVPSYNTNKPMHPRTNNWVGYILNLSSGRVYIAGDTDDTVEARNVKCDIALVPIGGKFTMDAKEAAMVINAMKPKVVIPTHFGKKMGNDFMRDIFHENVDKSIEIIDEIK